MPTRLSFSEICPSLSLLRREPYDDRPRTLAAGPVVLPSESVRSLELASLHRRVHAHDVVNYRQNLVVSVLCVTFHLVLKWATGVIKPIYKNKGGINDPDNYRGITLLSCLGKLFTSVINERLTVFIDSNQIMSEAQAGFRKGYSTTDQIFTLKCIVELFLCQGRRLFCTFVDYSKAFDSINRAILWKKTNIMWYIRKSPSCYIEYV